MNWTLVACVLNACLYAPEPHSLTIYMSPVGRNGILVSINGNVKSSKCEAVKVTFDPYDGPWGIMPKDMPGLAPIEKITELYVAAPDGGRVRVTADKPYKYVPPEWLHCATEPMS